MWQSPLTRTTLEARAQLMARLRSFFADQGLLEVDVPVLGARTVTDLHLEPLVLPWRGREHFLQTSPEFFMKRLLADGSGAIYYLGKAFRADEASRRHNPEFTLLEWYILERDDRALMAQTEALFRSLDGALNAKKFSYGALFGDRLGLDPHQASLAQLQDCAEAQLQIHWRESDRNTLLDLLFSHLIEPTLHELTFVYDYPASQCALARVMPNAEGVRVARRFEVFWRGLELANGYWELCDAELQRQRFAEDLRQRQRLGRPLPAVDENLMAALDAGLPTCAGIALGVDRLLMCLLGLDDIRQVITFPYESL